MKHRVKILDKEFKTKKAFGDYVSNWLKDHRHKTISDKSSYEYRFLLELLKRHPNAEEKMGYPIDAFFVTKATSKYDASATYILNSQGKLDFSWRSCISGKGKSVDANLKSAMRVSIISQIEEFKQSKPNKCERCIVGEMELEVDHYPDFSDLVKEFLKGRRDIPKQFDDHPRLHKATFKKSDLKFEAEWWVFHKNNASLMLLCECCHKQKTFSSKNVSITSHNKGISSL